MSTITQKKRIVIGDSQHSFAQAIAKLMDYCELKKTQNYSESDSLAHEDDDSLFEVISIPENSAELFQQLEHSEVDVIVLDFQFPGLDFHILGEWLDNQSRRPSVIFLSNSVSSTLIQSALNIQADGYLLKTDSLDELKEGLQKIIGGENFYSPQVEVHKKMGKTSIQYRDGSGQIRPGLTNRQLDILKRIASGQSLKEIAADLSLSEKSVDSHRYRLMKKLGIHDRVLLCRFAIREGLIEA